MASGRVGSGLIISRLDDGSWSAPSAMSTFDCGAGGQAGIELTDFVFAMESDEAVKKKKKKISSLVRSPLGVISL